MKKPFSFDLRPDIEAGKCKVVTGDGVPVSVVNYDYNGVTVAKYNLRRGAGAPYDLRLFVVYE